MSKLGLAAQERRALRQAMEHGTRYRDGSSGLHLRLFSVDEYQWTDALDEVEAALARMGFVRAPQVQSGAPPAGWSELGNVR